MPTEQPKTFVVEVTVEDIQVVEAALGNIAYRVAKPLMDKLTAQIMAQVERPLPAPPPPGSRAAVEAEMEVEGRMAGDRPRRTVADEPEPLRPERGRRSVNGTGSLDVDPDAAADTLAAR